LPPRKSGIAQRRKARLTSSFDHAASDYAGFSLVENPKALLGSFGHIRNAHGATHERDPRLLGKRLKLCEIPELPLAQFSISVTSWSRIQPRSTVSLDCSESANIFSGNAFLVDASPGWRESFAIRRGTPAGARLISLLGGRPPTLGAAA
jgi:hypothetical protein